MPRWQLVAALAAILIVYVAMRLPGMGVPLDRDEGAFGYMGQLINDGKLPYIDGVDHKPPVAFYINALALRFVPPTEWHIHACLLFYNFLTLVCIFFVGKIHFQSLSVGLWSAFAYSVFSSSPAIQGFSASTEMWMLLPVTLSLLLAVLAKRRNSFSALFASGFAGAAACWTKQTAFTSVLFVFIFAGFALFDRRNDRPPSKRSGVALRLTVWLAGATLFSALPMLYFYLHGAFREFFYWSFLHNLSYAGSRSLADSLGAVQDRLTEIIRGNFFILGAGVAAAAVRSARRQPEGYFILAFLLLSFLGTVPGYGYEHYFAQLAPAVAIAGGCGFSAFVEQCRTRKGRMTAAVVCGFLALIIPVRVGRAYYFRKDPDEISRLMFGANPFPESRSLGNFIAANTTPADTVFIIGSEPQILFYAKRRSPSSFPMMYPLMSAYPRYREFQDVVWAQVRRNPPKYILSAVNIPWSFLWDGKADMIFLDRMQKWMKQEYTVDRAMTVTGVHGDWIGDGDSRLQQGTPCIFILRKKK